MVTLPSSAMVTFPMAALVRLLTPDRPHVRAVVGATHVPNSSVATSSIAPAQLWLISAAEQL